MTSRSHRFRSVYRVLLLGTITLAASVVCAQTAPVQQASTLPSFSADQIRTMLNKSATSKVYFTPSAVRVEGVDNRGNPVTQILRFDRQVIWNLMQAQKTYTELPGSTFGWTSWTGAQQAQRESLGVEQVANYHCDKIRVHRMVMGQAIITLEWDARELNGLPIKTQDEHGTWSIELRNVQVGPQDPSLFEIPAAYQKLPSGSPQKPNK